MVRPQSVVCFVEEELLPDSRRPLMLEDFLAVPILTWMGRQLLAEGIQRFFVVCAPEFAAQAEVTVSDRYEDLMAFLDTPEQILVLNRSALPLAQAGPGFAYTASGEELRQAWRERMTNAVQGAALAAGWLPVFGRETLAELEPLFRAGEAAGRDDETKAQRS
mgnify:CR=1 FL=1